MIFDSWLPKGDDDPEVDALLEELSLESESDDRRRRYLLFAVHE